MLTEGPHLPDRMKSDLKTNEAEIKRYTKDYAKSSDGFLPLEILLDKLLKIAQFISSVCY